MQYLLLVSLKPYSGLQGVPAAKLKSGDGLEKAFSSKAQELLGVQSSDAQATTKTVESSSEFAIGTVSWLLSYTVYYTQGVSSLARSLYA